MGLRDTGKAGGGGGVAGGRGMVGWVRPQALCFWGYRRGRNLGTYEQSHPFADMTFIHEGNHTLVENLINFEKMVSSRIEDTLHWCKLGDMTVAWEGTGVRGD